MLLDQAPFWHAHTTSVEELPHRPHWPEARNRLSLAMVARPGASRKDAEEPLPAWLVRSYEVLHIFGILQAHVPVPCSVAPLLAGSSWAVVCARDLLIRGIESGADGG